MDKYDLCVAIADHHLRELGIERECDVEFFPSQEKRVLLPDNVFGIYVPAERTAYVRVTSLPRMVETLAHEAAHDFLLNNSSLGKDLVKRDILIRMYKNGEISAEVNEEDYKILYSISRFVNEGFASFAGCYVLNRFSREVMKEYELKERFGVEDLKFLRDVFMDVAAMYDGRPFDYYYGRLEFERISAVFGLKSTTLAALISMNVVYEVDFKELWEYYLQLRRKIYRKEDLSEPDLHLEPRFYMPVPHFRLLTFSRILPKVVDLIFDAKGEYFLRLIERTLGKEFLNPVVTKLPLPLSPLKLGYLLGEYERTKDPSVFRRFELPESLSIRLMYGGINVREVCKEHKEVYIGYLLSKLKRASRLRAKEILEELAYLGVRESYEVLRYLEYGAENEIKNFIERILDSCE